MKRSLTITIILLSLMSFISCELFMARPEPPEMHALFISLDYEQHRWPKEGSGSFAALPGAIQDIKEVAVAFNTLMSTDYFNTDGSITIMVEEDGVTKPDHLIPTRANIQTQLASYAVGGTQEIGENDIFLLYYTGHGGEFDKPMVVADTKDSIFVDYITVEDLNNWTSDIKGKVLLILDSCFSGQTIGDYPKAAEDREDMAYNPHMFNLTAASASQESYEVDFPSLGHRHGYCSRYFLEAMGWNHVPDYNMVDRNILAPDH